MFSPILFAFILQSGLSFLLNACCCPCKKKESSKLSEMNEKRRGQSVLSEKKEKRRKSTDRQPSEERKISMGYSVSTGSRKEVSPKDESDHQLDEIQKSVSEDSKDHREEKQECFGKWGQRPYQAWAELIKNGEPRRKEATKEKKKIMELPYFVEDIPLYPNPPSPRSREFDSAEWSVAHIGRNFEDESQEWKRATGGYNKEDKTHKNPTKHKQNLRPDENTADQRYPGIRDYSDEWSITHHNPNHEKEPRSKQKMEQTKFQQKNQPKKGQGSCFAERLSTQAQIRKKRNEEAQRHWDQRKRKIPSIKEDSNNWSKAHFVKDQKQGRDHAENKKYTINQEQKVSNLDNSCVAERMSVGTHKSTEYNQCPEEGENEAGNPLDEDPDPGDGGMDSDGGSMICVGGDGAITSHYQKGMEKVM